MPLAISARFSFTLPQPTDALLQFEAAAMPEQSVLRACTTLPRAQHTARVPAGGGIGERIWLRAEGLCEIAYEAEVKVERMLPAIASLPQVEPHGLPGEAVEYLFDSRYCQAGQLHDFVWSEFAGLSGGALVLAMREWLRANIAYQPGASDAATTALDTFNARAGICRDFAHVMVCFARAAMIPARYVSCFAPGVKPQDFHAVAEVFLGDPAVPGGGAWHLVDATGMADRAHTAKIGIGRDAADVSFLTVFGASQFHTSEVVVSAV
jgi:transglutaminase-like putative cysteine protease